MHFISRYRVLCTLTTVFFTVLSASPSAWSRPPDGSMPLSIEAREVLRRIQTDGSVSIENFAALSIESKQMLKRIQTTVDAYKAHLKSGEIGFTVTLHQKHKADPSVSFLQFLQTHWDALLHPKAAEKAPAYEDIGFWHITYKFNGNTQFFDVKARKKREINGGTIFIRAKDGRLSSTDSIWQETHHQYLIDKEKLYIRDGATWRPYVDTGAGPVFDERFSPRWWIEFSQAGPFEKFMHPYKPVRVQTTDMEGTPLYYLQAHRRAKGNDGTPYTTLTRDIWLDPQKDFHVTRIVTCEKGTGFSPYEGTFWPFRPPGEELYMGIRCNIKTYQLTQYEPGIWFPKIVTEEEKRSAMSMFDLFPSTPFSKYPPIVVSFLNDTRLPEWFEEGALPEPRFKKTMKVHRAIFNIRVLIPGTLP